MTDKRLAALLTLQLLPLVFSIDVNSYFTCGENRNLTWALGDGLLFVHPVHIVNRINEFVASNVTYDLNYLMVNKKDPCQALNWTGFQSSITLASFEGLNFQTLLNMSNGMIDFTAVIALTQDPKGLEPEQMYSWYGPWFSSYYEDLNDYENWAPGYPNNVNGSDQGCFSSSQGGLIDCKVDYPGLIPLCAVKCEFLNVGVVVNIFGSRTMFKSSQYRRRDV
jgi:hypothetical protein